MAMRRLRKNGVRVIARPKAASGVDSPRSPPAVRNTNVERDSPISALTRDAQSSMVRFDACPSLAQRRKIPDCF